MHTACRSLVPAVRCCRTGDAEQRQQQQQLTTSMPSTTWPNTTCLPSSHEVGTVHRKNYSRAAAAGAAAEDSSMHGRQLHKGVLAHVSTRAENGQLLSADLLHKQAFM